MADALKDRLRSDLTSAMRARDTVRTRTIRAALTAVQVEEVSGKEARELSGEQVVQVLTKEAKKRREAATAYDDAHRPELAEQERAELAVLEAYLPSQLSDEALTALIAEEVARAADQGITGKAGLGAVMKAVRPRVAGQAEGGRVAAEVRRQLEG